jgi:glutamate dehydrogenase
VLETLSAVERFDEDRILRGFLGLMLATLRTNRYAPTRRGCLSLKFDSGQVPDMPRPVPAVEVFVAGPKVQGVHLRGGPVARGGLRSSDRREDFRTEVLGLLKAQMTKNAVIVPTGSKGGFVLPRSIVDPLAVRDAVLDAYRTFVRGLLDVTDNVRGGQVLPPPGVRRHDGDDAYLVVAADKGTAAFSDIANEISAEYGFWLGDAFASGGSSGYDHKAMGITARGAWVAVRRHFRELDVDVQCDPVTVVGIGDMSGDVFGNGVLQSRSLRLVGAFDHRDVFLDPDPDPEVAFAERERLFQLANSSWRDYNRELISGGGGVWSRTQRAIPLSPEVRAILRVDAESLPPPALIRALLSAPVDLLFAGGIGTFVRATGESDLDVGDRANDAIRITATELGARVVGEGGNLSMTQRARIQYARRGGRCNTDAIDNVGGVDTSDREVNLKILLQSAIEAGELAPEDRDELLATMTDDVAAAVLTDVDRQVSALTAEVVASPRLLEAYESLMADLVEAGRLDREVEALPDSAEMARRGEAGAGLARPELCVLLGYSKVDHVARLLGSDLPDEPWLRTALDTYFPPLAVERFGHLISEHRLRRQLVATVVANDLVNRMGVTYVSRTAHELGCMSWEVAAAWWAAREVSDGERLWQMIEGLGDRITVALELELEAEVDRLVDTLTRTYLRHRVGSDIGRVVARDRPAFDELGKAVDDVAPPARGASRTLRGQSWIDLGIEPALAERIAALRELTIVPDVAVVAAETGAPVRHVGEVFWRLSEALPLDDLAARLGAVRTGGSWQYWQLLGLADEFRELRVSGAAQVVAEHPEAAPAEAVAAFLAERADARERVNVMLVALDRDTDGGLDALGVAVRTLRAALAPSRLPPPDPGPIGRPH